VVDVSEVLERLPTQERAPEQSGTLAELAERANREHHAAETAAEAFLDRAIGCGEALLEAQAHVERGQWTAWLKGNFDATHRTAYRYMRFAAYRDALVGAGPLNEVAALNRLAHLPRLTNSDVSFHLEVDPEIRRAALKRADEVGPKRAADELGVSVSSITNWRDPAAAKARHRRTNNKRHAAHKALREQRRQERRDEAARRANGAIGESYSLVRRGAQQLDAAVSEAKTDDARRALNSALRRMHQAEEEVVRALGVE
jgi:hypothetical protein